MPQPVTPITEIPPSARSGYVTRAPAALGDPFMVAVPDFDTRHVYEIRRWASRGATLPAEGDEVLVVEDERGEPWVSAWWPVAGDTGGGTVPAYDKGFVNHGSDGTVARPVGYASIEWLGSAEPENAIDGDTWIEAS